MKKLTKDFVVQVEFAGQSMKINCDETTVFIGRVEDNQIHIPSPNVSRQHAKLIKKEDKFYIVDLKSTNGTKINGNRISPNKEYRVTGHDLINFGLSDDVLLKVIYQNEEEETITKNVNQPQIPEHSVLSVDDSHEEIEEKEKSLYDDFLEKKAPSEVPFVEKPELSRSSDDELSLTSAPPLPPNVQSIEKNESQIHESLSIENQEVGEQKKNFLNKLEQLENRFKEGADSYLKKIRADELIKSEEISNTYREQMSELLNSTKDKINDVYKEEEQKAKDVFQLAQEKSDHLVEEANERVSELVRQYEERKSEATQELNEIRERKEALDQKKSNFDEEIKRERTRRDELKKEDAEELKRKLKEADEERERIIKEAQEKAEEEFKRAIYFSKEKNMELESKNSDLKSKLKEIERDYNEKKTLLDQVSRNLKEEKRKTEKAEEQSQETEELLRKLEKKKESLLDEIESKESFFLKKEEKFNKIIKKQTQKFKELKGKNSSFKSESSGLKKDIDKIKKQITEEEKKQVQLKSETDQLKERFDALTLREQALEKNVMKFSDIQKSQEEKLRFEREQKERELQDYVREQCYEAGSLIKKARKEASTILKAAKKNEKEIINKHAEKVKKKQKKIIENAEREAEKIVEEAKIEAEKVSQKAQKQSEKISEDAKSEAKLMRESLVSQGDELKRKSVQSELERLKSNTERLKIEFETTVTAQLIRLLEVKSKEDVIESFPKLINHSVDKIFHEKLDGSEIEDMLSQTSNPVEHQKNAKKYWLAVGGTVCLLLIGLFSYEAVFEFINKKTRVIAQEKDQKQKVAMQKKIEESKKVKPFDPEMDERYRNSYTDRVLYTEGYVERELDSEYREAWILALEEYIINEKRVSEDKVIPFVAHEVNLINELKAQKSAINGYFVKEGVNVMKDIEKSFLDKVKKTMNRKLLVDILVFKKSFYENYEMERLPTSENSDESNE